MEIGSMVGLNCQINNIMINQSEKYIFKQVIQQKALNKLKNQYQNIENTNNI